MENGYKLFPNNDESAVPANKITPPGYPEGASLLAGEAFLGRPAPTQQQKLCLLQGETPRYPKQTRQRICRDHKRHIQTSQRSSKGPPETPPRAPRTPKSQSSMVAKGGPKKKLQYHVSAVPANKVTRPGYPEGATLLAGRALLRFPAPTQQQKLKFCSNGDAISCEF